MKGLLKNNYYAMLPNTKVLLIVVSFLLVLNIGLKNQILMISYVLLCMLGFPLNSVTSLQKESVTKWNKYKLTMPVTRAAIVRSYYVSLLLCLSVGIVFAGVGIVPAIMLHGFPFDKNIDIFMLLVAGASSSLFMGAIFLPLFYSDGEERGEMFLVISVLCGIGIVFGIIVCINMLVPPPVTTMQLILSGIGMLVSALIIFAVSYPLTVAIYHKKEY
ncbi:MAG: ABC-2 transporter permease [Treponema sp.]|uniref:ABC-2 transporter permease n=1 Tax=Treponema sp. TaxID=166 RepID=UPI003FA3031B